MWHERLDSLNASLYMNIHTEEHRPAGAESDWITRKALNGIRTQVGRSRINMLKWGYYYY